MQGVRGSSPLYPHDQRKPGSRSRSCAGGSHPITKLRVIEKTGEYRQGKYQPHDAPTTHFVVEVGFELGHNAAASLHRGDAVIVIGREHTTSWGDEGNKQYGCVIDADTIGADLTRATAAITRNARDDQQP